MLLIFHHANLLLSKMAPTTHSGHRWWELEALQLLKSTKAVDDIRFVLKYVPIMDRKEFVTILAKRDVKILLHFLDTIDHGGNKSDRSRQSLAETIHDRLTTFDSPLSSDEPESASSLAGMTIDRLNEEVQRLFRGIPLAIWIREALGYRPKALKNLYALLIAARSQAYKRDGARLARWSRPRGTTFRGSDRVTSSWPQWRWRRSCRYIVWEGFSR